MLRLGLSFFPGLRRAVGRARQAYRLRDALDLRRFRERKRFSGEHIAVAGLFSTRTGLGRAAELVALTLERRGHHVTRVDLAASLGMQTRTARQDCIQPTDCGHLAITDVLFVINPDHPALSAFETDWLVQRCILGHWIWELEVLPPFWRRATISYDEIRAPTDLVRDVIAAHIDPDMPIEVLPYGVDLDPMAPANPALRIAVRQRLGIGREAFVIGYSFAVDSNYYRKNPEDCVRVFMRAFPATDDATRLYLRCNDFAHRPIERARLDKVIAGDPRVIIFDGTNPLGIADFYAAIDLYLSTSRAEGYGLNLMEASQSGLPVITTGWRIPSEITALPGIRTADYQLINVADPQGHYASLRGAKWAAPDLDAMEDMLRSAHAAAAVTNRTGS